MLKQLFVVAGLLLALGGAAHAEVTCDAARPGENKQQEFQRLLDCTRQSIIDAKTRLNFLSDMKMDELEASLERERDILNGLIETRQRRAERGQCRQREAQSGQRRSQSPDPDCRPKKRRGQRADCRTAG